MGRRYLQKAFTDSVQRVQIDHGTRALCSWLSRTRKDNDSVLGENEVRLIETIESFFIATLSESGWPYVQHRGGPAGFLKVLASSLIGFPVFDGNQQFLTSGNLQNDSRVSLILVDYTTGRRLKIMGYGQNFDVNAAPEWTEKLGLESYQSNIRRVTLIDIVAFDWNCSGHIPYMHHDRDVCTKIAELEAEVADLRAHLTSGATTSSSTEMLNTSMPDATKACR